MKSAPAQDDIPEISPRPNTPDVYRLIALVAAELAKEGIGKNQQAQAGGSRYAFRGIDDVYNAMAPLLSRHGLVVLPRYTSRTVSEKPSKSGGMLFCVTLDGEFDLVAATDGSKHTIRLFGEAMDSGDKATNKAMSAAYKYAMMQTFCIPVTGESVDSERDDPQPDLDRGQRFQDPPQRPSIKDLLREALAAIQGIKTQEDWTRIAVQANKDFPEGTPERAAVKAAFLEAEKRVPGAVPPRGGKDKKAAPKGESLAHCDECGGKAGAHKAGCPLG